MNAASNYDVYAVVVQSALCGTQMRKESLIRVPLVNCSSPVESVLSIEREVYQGVVSRRTTNRQIAVPAERHVRRNITLKPGSVSNNAPGYLTDDCKLVADAGVRQLHSADTRTLVSRTRAVWETGPLPPQHHESGTVCCPISDYVGCHTASSGGYWRHFYSNSEATVQCELFLTAPNRNILIYLLS